MLWCLALYEGLTHSDLLLNIDRLSNSSSYQVEMQAELLKAGIPGIEFSLCQIPQGRYTDKDLEFFEPLELRVH
jgi:hypothetical protein